MEIFFKTCSKYSGVLHIGFLIIFILSMVLLSLLLKNRKSKKEKIFVILLFFYHYVFSVLFIMKISASSTGVDAISYYDLACGQDSWFASYGTGLYAIGFILFPFVKFLRLSFIEATYIFSFLGFLGVYYSWRSLKNYMPSAFSKTSKIWLLFFLPSLHFWCSSIGKESVIIFCIGLIIFALSDLKNEKVKLFIGLAIILHIRPYFFFIIIVSIILSIIKSKKNFTFKRKVLVIAIIFTLAIPAVNHFKKQLKIDLINQDYLSNRIEHTYNDWGGKSDINLREYSIPMKIFSFMFRPFFFDAHNTNALLASFENLILIIFILLFFRFKLSANLLKSKNFYPQTLLFIFILGLIVLAMVTGNLGTAFRKKTMIILPMINFLFLNFALKKEKTSPFYKIDVGGSVILVRVYQDM